MKTKKTIEVMVCDICGEEALDLGQYYKTDLELCEKHLKEFVAFQGKKIEKFLEKEGKKIKEEFLKMIREKEKTSKKQ